MKEYLEKLPQEIKDLVYLISDTACREDTAVYLVGGFVRDLILGVKNLDVDIVVEGDGISFAEKLSVRLNAKLVSHKRFGTAVIMVKPHLKIDVASARNEHYPKPAHLPIVSSGTLREDLYRRDFTINAMAISIGREAFGRLIDFFCGKRDLFEKKIRILHNLSFIDDPTRIFRAIRFEKRYNFKIEPLTLKILKESVKLNMLHKVQPQRLREELILILKEERPLVYIKRIQALAGLDFIKPGLCLSKKTYQLIGSLKKQLVWFKETYPQKRPIDEWLIFFIGIIDSLTIKDTQAICKKFVLRLGEEKRLLLYKEISRKFILNLCREKVRPSEIFAGFEPLSYEILLLLKAKYKGKAFQKHIKDFFEIYNGMRILISGHDLGALGVKPGPVYQKIFSKVLNAKLDGIVKTKDEELALIRKIAKIH
ncbi:MAG: hypothetical protein QMD94_05560 [Candidatus Omnitrophota bacterium]|nr:hypothetical protein [Candidatus Omnitrophota bacterium]